MSDEKKKELVKQEGTILEILRSDGAKKQFAMALPDHLSPDRFVRIAITAITKTPKLLQCTKESLISCLLDCSQLGLEPDGRKVHLIPYGTACTMIIDYKGLVELARRSGDIADIHADVVYENDKFDYSFGSDNKLSHKPALQGRGDPIAAYSFVKLKDTSVSFEIMNKDEIDAIRKRSKAKDSGPWVTDWAEMAKKTVFRRHSKWLPMSSQFIDAVDKDYDVPLDIGKGFEPAMPNIPETITPQQLTEKVFAKQEEKKIESPTPQQKKALSALDGKIEKLRIEVGELFHSNDRFFNILGTYGCEEASQLTSAQKLEFINELEQTIKNAK